MQCSTKKLRSPLKTFGGKSYLARRIVALFPEHETYVEPFVGGGSVLLNKSPSQLEFAGDLNAGLIDFWETLQEDEGFLDSIGHEYSEDIFRKASSWLHGEYRLDRAVGFMIRSRFSRGGLGKDFAWSERIRGGQPGDVNAWETILRGLPAIIDRVRYVRFRRVHAAALICDHDSPGTLIYCDPPYLHETRTTRDAYTHEMTAAGHRRLLGMLRECESKIFISGYRSFLYDEILAGWTRHEFSIANHSGQGKQKQRRIECVWESPSK
jgi:DNA adenine methylase